MHFLVLAIALMVDKFFSLNAYRRQWRIAHIYIDKMQATFSGKSFFHDYLGLAALLLPGVVVILLLQFVLGDVLGGLLLPIFSLLLLLYALGGCDFQNNPEAIEPQLEKAMYLFTLIFWFIILGAFGIVICCLLQTLLKDEASGFYMMAKRTYNVVAWVPVRLLSASFALVGNFNDVLESWLLKFKSVDNLVLLIDTAKLAVNNEFETVRTTQLLNRALLIWLALFALIILI